MKRRPELDALSEAVADAARSGTWTRARKALVEAIANAPDAEGLSAIATLDGLDDGFVGEADVGRAVVQAVVDRALAASDPAEAAAILGWAIRCCAFDPCAFATPERATAKPEAAAAVRARMKALVAWADDAAPERRAALAIAAAWGGVAPARLLALAEDSEPLVRASALLALRAQAPSMSRQHQDRLAPLVETASKIRDPLVELAAAGLAAWLGPLEAKLAKVLVTHARTGKPTPPAWGMRDAEGRLEKTSRLAISILSTAEIADAAPLVEALATAKRPKLRGARLAQADLLVRLAFDARGRPPATAGIVQSELDPLSRRVLEVLAHEDFQGIVPTRLGVPTYHNHEIRAFLAAKTLSWRPIDVAPDGAFHFAGLAGRVATRTIPKARALKACLAALEAEELAALAVTSTTATMAVDDALGTAALQKLRADFCLAVLDAAAAAGLDRAAFLARFEHGDPFAEQGLYGDRALLRRAARA